MSLTTCPDCGHEVSTSAAACPNCGYAMNAAAAPAATAPPATPVTPATSDTRERAVYKERRVSIGNIIIGLIAVTLLILAVLWYMGVLRFV